jgi:AcrR family transcriptional regulator
MARIADPHRREDILHAAREVFLECGYSDARLSDIAKRAGVVVSTLYLYFASKEEMVEELARDIYIEVAKVTLPLLETLRTREDLRRFVQAVLSLSISNRDLLRLQFLDTGLQSVRMPRLRRPRGPHFQALKQALEQRIAQGFIRPYDPTILLDLLIGFQVWIFQTYPLLEEEELALHEEMFVEWLANALLPAPTSA